MVVFGSEMLKIREPSEWRRGTAGFRGLIPPPKGHDVEKRAAPTHDFLAKLAARAWKLASFDVLLLPLPLPPPPFPYDPPAIPHALVFTYSLLTGSLSSTLCSRERHPPIKLDNSTIPPTIGPQDVKLVDGALRLQSRTRKAGGHRGCARLPNAYHIPVTCTTAFAADNTTIPSSPSHPVPSPPFHLITSSPSL